MIADALPNGQKSNQEYFVQNLLPSLLHEKKRFARQKTAINSVLHMNNSMCYNGHREFLGDENQTLLSPIYSQ